MRIDILGLSFRRTPAIVRHAEERVKQAIGSLAPLVGRAWVRLWDTNGARGGEDMACRIAVRLPGGNTILADAVDRNLYAAMDQAAEKLKQALRRRQFRRRTLRRHRAQRQLRAALTDGR